MTEPCTAGTTAVNFCWAETETSALLELSGEEPFTFKKEAGTTTKLKGTIGGLEVIIACEEATGEGRNVQLEPLKVDYTVLNVPVTFTKCKLEGPEKGKCTVKEELKTELLKGDPETDETTRKLSEEFIRFIPEEGEAANFMILSISGEATGCPATVLGSFKVKGAQECKWVEQLLDLLEHLVKCAETESLLTWGGYPMTFELTAAVKPASLGDFWDVEEVA